MLSSIKIILASIIALVLGLGIGSLAMWGIQRVKVAEAERMKTEAILAKNTMQVQWQKALKELNQTRVVLNDTLAALELLRQYQRIDDETKKDINDLEKTLDPEGNVTIETEDKFRSLVDNFNRLNGNLGSNGREWLLWDIQPFKNLRQDAESLYKRTEEIAIELGLDLKEEI